MVAILVKTIPGLVGQAMSRGAIQIPEELEKLAQMLAPRQIVNCLEIGSESGGSFWLWCQLAHEDGIKISIDKPDGASGSWKFADSAASTARSAHFRTFGKNVYPIVADSHSPIARGLVRKALQGDLLDFLFIDGDHTYEGVSKDFTDYREFVRPGGLIAFHDITDTQFHRDRGCFVADFWRDLQGNKTELCCGFEWGGIGVIEN